MGWDATDRFAFVWDSVEVSAQRFSLTYTGRRDLYECERALAVTGKIHVLDAHGLIGMQVGDPDILRVIDSEGSSVAWTPLPWRPLRQYQELKYERTIPQDPLAKPELVLQPYDVTVSICIDPNQEPVSALSAFQWCAYALYAEDTIEADVPFAASEDWREVLPGVEIRVTKATVECCDYTYWTEVRHTDGIVRAFGALLSPDEPPADCLVMETLLLDTEGNPVVATEDPRVSPAIWSQRVESTSWNTAKCGGRLLTFSTQAEIAGIRHMIVVGPYEVSIPFDLRNLPIPSFWCSGMPRGDVKGRAQ